MRFAFRNVCKLGDWYDWLELFNLPSSSNYVISFRISRLPVNRFSKSLLLIRIALSLPVLMSSVRQYSSNLPKIHETEAPTKHMLLPQFLSSLPTVCALLPSFCERID